LSIREPKKNINRARDPRAYRESKKVNKREKQAQYYFDTVSNRSLSGPAAFIHPADHVPWSKKKSHHTYKKSSSNKIRNEKANSQTGYVLVSIIIIVIIVIILLAILLG
jgi:hypothetical protein